MAELSPDIVAEVVEACTSGAQEAAVALGRALDTEVQISVGEPGSVDLQALPEAFTGPGLVVVLTAGSTAAVVLLPENSGLLPSWCEAPDPTGQSKLATLAQELGMILLPEQHMPEAFEASRVQSLSEALARGGVCDGAPMLPLELRQSDGTDATAYLIWPAPNPSALIGQPAAEAKPEAKAHPGGKPQPQPSSQPKPVTKPGPPAQRRPAGPRDLPGYTRSLLRIKLPVVVTLARKRQPVGQITQLGPGSIIQFEKSCEEMLELEIGGRSIATGEAVKVGDKFGLRINSMILPDERFAPARRG